MNELVYLDNAATTPVAKSVREEMSAFFRDKFGNPSSLYSAANTARKEGLERSRDKISDYLGVKQEEIIFTSGATESDNLAIKGVALSRDESAHFITTEIEHHAVLHAFEWLEDRGHDVTFLEVDELGRVKPEDLENAIRDDTALVSIMYANNEIGTIEPIENLAEIAAESGALFHTDAVQSFGKFPLDLENVDLLSASGHKIYGPKGVGFLYRRKGVKLEPLLHGGGHEKGLRSGTENVPGIVGLAAATELMAEEQGEEIPRERALREKIIENVLKIPDARLNGPDENRLANNANFSFKGIEGESIVMKLDNRNIAASTGSACSSPSLEPSHVLLSIGLPLSLAHGSLRITLGRETQEEDVEYLLEELPEVVDELRRASPLSN
ncbi:MAG: cysteine desulfurase family protein [Candidatus Bipolaricaulota bacterium]|nr:cysteine desulfurase [Candidatus Bipolaricaulota bacterium]MBS3791052.1 cysteine desulfurase [Candidatus Bipolaricaulota bacterium]